MSHMRPIPETVLETAEEIFQTLRMSNTALFGDRPIPDWVFRGHSDASWKLQPGVWRDDFLPRFGTSQPFLAICATEAARQQIDHPGWQGLYAFDTAGRLEKALQRMGIAYALLRNFVHTARSLGLLQDGEQLERAENMLTRGGHIVEFFDPELESIAQHYGIPTRLLDWSYDPLSALYFALEGSRSGVDAVVWGVDLLGHATSSALNRRHPYSPSVEIFHGDRHANQRVRSQRGVFTFIWNAESHYANYGTYPTVENYLTDLHARKFIIRPSDREKTLALVNLFRERKTRAHLMPDLESCASVAKSAFSYNFNL